MLSLCVLCRCVCCVAVCEGQSTDFSKTITHKAVAKPAEGIDLASRKQPRGLARTCFGFSLAVFGLLVLNLEDAKADIFTLRSGGKVVGELVPSEQSSRSYTIETGQGILITLDREVVAKHERTRPAIEEYERIKPTYPDTVEGQLALANWCREQNLYTQRREHLQRIIELNPEHKEARSILGYIRTQEGWMTRDEVMTSRGYVKRGRRWYLPQQLDLMDQRKKEEKAQKEWYRKIRLWRNWIDKGRPQQRQEAVVRLRTLDDALALPAIKYNLEEDPRADVRLLYIHALSRMDSMASNDLLVQLNLTDPNREVRLEALDHLVRKAEDRKNPEITVAFIRALNSKDTTIINRAAYALGQIGDIAAVPALIDALVTKQKFKVTLGNPGGGIGATFSRPGGSSNSPSLGGLSAGSSTRVVSRYIQNTTVLETLTQLTNHNFRYNIQAWKNWLAAQKTPESANARRD